MLVSPLSAEPIPFPSFQWLWYCLTFLLWDPTLHGFQFTYDYIIIWFGFHSFFQLFELSSLLYYSWLLVLNWIPSLIHCPQIYFDDKKRYLFCSQLLKMNPKKEVKLFIFAFIVRNDISWALLLYVFPFLSIFSSVSVL